LLKDLTGLIVGAPYVAFEKLCWQDREVADAWRETGLAYSSRRGKKDGQGTVDSSVALQFLEGSHSMFPWSPFPSL